jgi:long-chain acyl-CoA synthetase
VATTVTSLIQPVNLIFINRVRPDVILESISRYGVTHVIGSITVFNALLDLADATSAEFATLKYIYSGGAPIPPATVAAFLARFGRYIHNVCGMTETASAVIAVPPGSVVPVDAPAEHSRSVCPCRISWPGSLAWTANRFRPESRGSWSAGGVGAQRDASDPRLRGPG